MRTDVGESAYVDDRREQLRHNCVSIGSLALCNISGSTRERPRRDIAISNITVPSVTLGTPHI